MSSFTKAADLAHKITAGSLMLATVYFGGQLCVNLYKSRMARYERIALAEEAEKTLPVEVAKEDLSSA